MLQMLMPGREHTRSMPFNIEAGTSLCAAVKNKKSSDRAFISDTPPFFMVADGNGPEDHGELAAALATRRMQRCLDDAWPEDNSWRWPLSWGPAPENINPDAPEIILNHARNLTHEYLLDFKSRHNEWRDFSAALTTAFIAGRTFYASQTGTNRIYLFRDNDLHRISNNSSNAMIGDAHSHIEYLKNSCPDRLPFLVRKDLIPGDRLLLCTKGISTLTYQELHATMTDQGQSAEATAEAIISSVHAKGPLEDTAVLVICVSQGGKP